MLALLCVHSGLAGLFDFHTACIPMYCVSLFVRHSRLGLPEFMVVHSCSFVCAEVSVYQQVAGYTMQDQLAAGSAVGV